MAAVWGIDPDELPGPGISAYEMLDRLGTDGGVRVLLLAASNPVVSAPNARHVTERLDALDLLCVADFFLSETARRADVVLPTTQWAEEDGTMTNVEGRILLRRKAFDPPAHARSDLEILHGIAARLGRGEFFPTDPEIVFAELGRASAGGAADYAGITLDRLRAGERLHWPCPTPTHPGTPRLFLDRFATPDGRARFVPVTPHAAVERPTPDYPYLLITGRTRGHYQSGTQTRRSPSLRRVEPSPHAELHPELARAVGVTDGDRIRLSTPRGRAELRARLSPDIRSDTVFVPFHWAGAATINVLTCDALDPTSRMPEFKTCPVAVARAESVPPPPGSSPMHSTPRFLQGIYDFTGQGSDKPTLLHDALTYTVPAGVITQPLYFRGGNATDELVTVVLVRDGAPMRYFPIGARASCHVQLAVVEDIEDGSVLELQLAAPEGLIGSVVVDLGLVEV